MALPKNINDREQQKFEDVAPGITAVRVTATNFSGSFTPSGLTVGGKLTKVILNNVTWTALPPVALINRNALSIQNISSSQIVIDYETVNPLVEGVSIGSGAERFYSIKDTIIIYGKSVAASAIILIEELA